MQTVETSVVVKCSISDIHDWMPMRKFSEFKSNQFSPIDECAALGNNISFNADQFKCTHSNISKHLMWDGKTLLYLVLLRR